VFEKSGRPISLYFRSSEMMTLADSVEKSGRPILLYFRSPEKMMSAVDVEKSGRPLFTLMPESKIM